MAEKDPHEQFENTEEQTHTSNEQNQTHTTRQRPPSLFTPVKIYQLVDDFRSEVKAQLPEAKASELTKLCESEASPRVSFETAKEKTISFPEKTGEWVGRDSNPQPTP